MSKDSKFYWRMLILNVLIMWIGSFKWYFLIPSILCVIGLILDSCPVRKWLLKDD